MCIFFLLVIRNHRQGQPGNSRKIYVLFAGWEVRMVKNFDRGLENAARGRSGHILNENII